MGKWENEKFTVYSQSIRKNFPARSRNDRPNLCSIFHSILHSELDSSDRSADRPGALPGKMGDQLLVVTYNAIGDRPGKIFGFHCGNFRIGQIFFKPGDLLV